MTRKLLVLALVMGLLVPTAAAAPLAAPCTPGASYNSTCDVNQDGSITVTDLQLTAGHWNQSGTFVSDSNHTHLGQTWTGANNPLKLQGPFGAPDYAPIVLSNTQGHGLAIPSASIDGIYVGTVGAYGMVVNDAELDGVYVGTAGNPTSSTFSSQTNGFEVAGAAGHGLYVGRADNNGILVESAGQNGMSVNSASLIGVYVASADTAFAVGSATANGMTVLWANSNGVYVAGAGADGVRVNDANSDGVQVWDADGNGVNADGMQYGGYFWGNIYVDGVCVSCRPANFAVNVGERPLQPGDVVSVRAVTATDFDTAPALWEVVPAQPGQAVAGVVAGRAEFVTEQDHRPDETGKRLVPREGAAAPGDYVTIVFSGPMQVKVAAGEGAIAAGTRLTAAADGQVRSLQTRTIEGMLVTEGAPVLGATIDASKDGLVWVLVNP